MIHFSFNRAALTYPSPPTARSSIPELYPLQVPSHPQPSSSSPYSSQPRSSSPRSQHSSYGPQRSDSYHSPAAASPYSLPPRPYSTGPHSMSPSSGTPTPLSAHPNSEGFVQQFQIQLPGGPQTPSSRATSAYQYGGPSGVRASVACDACRKRKVKCTVVHAQTPLHPLPGQEPPPRVCARCSRLGIDCSWKDEKKTGKPRAKASAQSLEVVFESYPNQGPNGYVYVLTFISLLYAHTFVCSEFLHAIRLPSWTNHYLSCQFVNHLVHNSPETLCASNLAFLDL